MARRRSRPPAGRCACWSVRWLLADAVAPAAAGAAQLHVSAQPTVDSAPLARPIEAGVLVESNGLRVLLDRGLRIERRDGTAWRCVADGLELTGAGNDGKHWNTDLRPFDDVIVHARSNASSKRQSGFCRRAVLVLAP